jgi:hypothetical protein
VFYDTHEDAPAFRPVIRDDGRPPVAAGVTILIAFFAASFDES